MISIHIEGMTGEEVREQMKALLGWATASVENRINFGAALAQAAVQTYEPDADDEAEVNEDIVQNVDTGATDGLDSAGEAWDEAIHSPNRTTTKDGRWRLKKGAVRPENGEAAGSKSASSDTASDGGESGASTDGTITSSTTTATTSTAPNAASPSDEEDEFAAFANAMKTEEPVVEAEPVEVPARTWTDADLSKLCNMAAQKLGGGDPVKKIIATYTPEGEVPHSRNVPLESREDFAQAIEATAGIEYAG